MADLATLIDLRDRLANATGPDRDLGAHPECDIDQRPPGQPALALCRAIVEGLIALEEANG